MNDDTLATELLRTLKGSIKRLYIIIVILISMLFVSNIAWKLPKEETVSELSQEADDNAVNNYIGNDGGINGG